MVDYTMSRAAKLLPEIEKLPTDWSLVACGNNKGPQYDNWTQIHLKLSDFREGVESGFIEKAVCNDGNPLDVERVWAIGVLCGTPSGGLLFVDHDGNSCSDLILGLSGADTLLDALPKTAVVTSGRKGRYQLIYRVPEIYWNGIQTHKISTGHKSDDGKPEQLEFRWDGCQSVVLGHHPMTSGYEWRHHPNDIGIATAPLWMIEQMLKIEEQPTRIAREQRSNTSEFTDTDWALSYLNSIPATDDYETWLSVGMALHSVSLDLLEEWDEWSSGASNYEPGVCDRKWKSFKRSGSSIGTLGYLAKQHGWESPVKQQEVSIKSMPEVALSEKKGTDYDTYRRAIASALAKEDPNERDFELSRIPIRFNIPRNVVETAVERLTAPTVNDTDHYFALDQLLDTPDIALSWVIDGLIPKGEAVLLSAKPKTGKSLLAYAAAKAVVTGGNFLGEQAKPGKVLIIQCEEGKFTLKHRMMAFDMDAIDDKSRLNFITQFDVTRDMTRLERILETLRPDLVIIDSLRKISSRSRYDENSAEFARPIYELSDLLRQYNAAGIFIHHDRKNPGDKEGQGIDNVAGTSALPGAVWGIWRLVKTSTAEEDPKRQLSITVRGSRGSRHSLRLEEGEGNSFDWIYEGELNTDPTVKSWQNKIIDCLRFHQTAPSPKFRLSMNDLRDFFGLPAGDKTLNKPLNRAIERQLITCEKDEINKKLRWYSLPLDPGYPPPPYKSDRFSSNISETQSEREFNNGGQHGRQPVINGGQQGLSTISDEPVHHLSDTCPPLSNRVQEGVSNATGKNFNISGGEGGTSVEKEPEQNIDSSVSVIKQPWSERNGVVQYRKDARPLGKSLPKTDVVSSVEISGTEIAVGTRVVWNNVPTNLSFMIGKPVQVEAIRPGYVRLPLVRQWVPIAEISVYQETPVDPDTDDFEMF